MMLLPENIYIYSVYSVYSVYSNDSFTKTSLLIRNYIKVYERLILVVCKFSLVHLGKMYIDMSAGSRW